jgi:hypothetical protein
MNEESMSFLFGVLLLIVLSTSGLMYSSKREIMRLENNFIARLSNGDWDKASGVLPDNFEWVRHENRDKGIYHSKAEFLAFMKDQPDKTGVDYRIHDITQISETRWVIQTRFSIRYYNALHNWTISWNAQCTWEKIGSNWQLTEIIETSPHERNTSN